MKHRTKYVRTRESAFALMKQEWSLVSFAGFENSYNWFKLVKP